MSLTLKEITKLYEEKKVLDSFSYSFPECGMFVLTGKSGIGKTTLLRIIAGLDKDYIGEASGGGIGRVSVAFQEHRLFERLTALDNIICAVAEKPDNALRERALGMLLEFGFTKEETGLFPNELSGGMKQRVSLIRAIIMESPILLLDEPTKELDEGLRRALYERLKAEARRRLIITVSHNKEEIAYLDAVNIELR